MVRKTFKNIQATNKVIGILFFFLMAVFCHGQNVLPPVYNYNLSEYGGGSKNWGLALNKRGELFVANNKGLLHYNGEDWSLNKLPDNTIIRSVTTVGDSIYTGSYEEFGYWKKDAIGKLEYTSLTHLIKEYSFTSEEFWEILHIDDAIVFRSFSSIYIFRDGEIKVIDPPQIISDFIVYDDKIIVAAGNSGLFELTDDKLTPLPNQELLLNKNVTDMVLFDDGLLVGTKLNGCYFYDGTTVKPWQTEINEDLKLHQLNKVVYLGRGKLAFGTIKNGMYLFDTGLANAQIFNKASGLQNNTVLSMTQYQSQLWLGLDNGLARVKLDNPITYYTDFTGALGTVYDMQYFNEKLYLGSNTGVFCFDNGELRFINGSQGHVWDLKVVEDDLLVGHNTGTYEVDDGNFDLVSPISGGYEIKKIPEQRTVYIQGTYNGLARFEKLDNDTWNVERVSGVDFPIKQLCFETPTILWAVHPYKGFFRIHFSSDYREVSRLQEFNGDGAPSKYNVRLYNVKNQIVFYSEGNWFKYDPIGDRIVAFEEFDRYNNKELLFFDEDYFWFVNAEGDKELVYTDLKRDNLLITDLPLQERLVPDSQRMVKANDSTMLIALSDGFAKINSSALLRQSKETSLPVPQLSVLYDEKNSYSLSGKDETITIPYKHSQHISIAVASPELIQSRYRYELQGPKEYTEIVESGTIEFQNLPHGSYSFKVATVGMGNKVSEAQTINFEISPPWYLSWGSFLLYMALAVITVLIVRRYNRKKLMRKQLELEAQMKKEQQERLAKLEKEKLAKEIKQKQNELASTTLNIAKKNEMILELKNMLLMNKDKFSNSQRYRSFMKKLNNSVKDTEDWKRFEVNFKELHEDFFERLLKSYPSLTPKDLKLCAYLKMNLSTKEIAPLMAISIRGVEIHRYRLRKKLQLEGSENLSNFLITF
ncbi:Two component regulator three Y domain-containing protein [Allomuricauda sp. d1]|uniref:Two component regulator three Y domain-containing protein n=1 Tax=Allomuricauda sp. d1 TaxID=3136725 RepID=UPI0031D635FF